jgi:hypothetical protein
MSRLITRVIAAFGVCAAAGSAAPIALTSVAETAGQPPAIHTDLFLHEAGKPGLTRLTTASEPGRVSSGASVSGDGNRIVFNRVWREARPKSGCTTCRRGSSRA